jgi:hypothetical protein
LKVTGKKGEIVLDVATVKMKAAWQKPLDLENNLAKKF